MFNFKCVIYIFLIIYSLGSLAEEEQLKSNDSETIGERDAKLFTNLKKSKQFSDAFKSQPDFESTMEQCKNAQKAFNDCISDYIEKKGFSFEELEKISKELNPNIDTSKISEVQKAQDKTGALLNFNESTNLSSEKSKEYFILKKYLSNELAKNLYGENYAENNISKNKIADHNIFIQLYRTQLGKNVLLELSKFCLENFPKDSSKSGDYDAAKSDDYQDEIKKRFSTAASTKAEGDHFQQCNQCIDYFCHQYNDSHYKDSAKLQSAKRCKYLLSSSKKKDEVVNNSCVLLPRVRQYREAIVKLDKVQEVLKKDGDKRGHNWQTAGFKGIYKGLDDNENEKSIEDLTTISSAQVINESGLGKKLDKNVKDFEEKCLIKKDIKSCQELVEFQDAKFSLDDLKKEFDTKTQLMLAKLGTEKGIKEYIQSVKGKTPEEMDKLIRDELLKDPSLDQLRKEFKAQLSTEREELRKQIISKMQSTTIQDINKDKKNIKNVDDILKDKKGRLQRLFHYNNIVTSYIERELNDGEKKSSIADTRSFEKELKDSAYADDDIYFKNFKQNADTALKQIQAEHDTRTPASNKTDTSRAISKEFLDMVLGNE